MKRLREQVKNHSVINNLTQQSPLSFETLKKYQSNKYRCVYNGNCLLHIFLMK